MENSLKKIKSEDLEDLIEYLILRMTTKPRQCGTRIKTDIYLNGIE